MATCTARIYPPHLRPKRPATPGTDTTTLLSSSTPRSMSAMAPVFEMNVNGAPSARAAAAAAADDLDMVDDGDFGQPSRTSSPLPEDSFHAPVVQRYRAEDLVGIGRQCSNRLPPASAVQAMFLYELQRESEAERLFHSQMFRLAKSEDEVAVQSRRFAEMQSRMLKLETQLALQGQAQEQRIAAHEARLTEAEGKLSAIADQLNNVQKLEKEIAAAAIDEAKRAAQDAVAADAVPSCGAFPTNEFHNMQVEIDVLFHDRDGIIAKLTAARDRIEDLVQDVHQLKTQTTESQVSNTTTTTEDLVDTSIPNGKPAWTA